MKTLPVVAIVGRPNVGKSTLFNRLTGRRISIEDSTRGTTRDRISANVTEGGAPFALVDTGGMFIDDPDALTALIHEQIEQALLEADVLVLTVDAREERTALDDRVAERLRTLDKTVVVAANMCDTQASADSISAFAGMGCGGAVAVAAMAGDGCDDLLARIRTVLPALGAPAVPPDIAVKIAFVGRRNTGKSTLLNALAGETRVIVSEVPGTTRDAVDVEIRWKDKSILAIDTAGIRPKGKTDSSIEFFSLERTERAIRRADICVLLLDAREEITALDRRIGSLLEESSKPVILGVNKWDLAKSATTEQYATYLINRFPGLSYAPVAFLSAKEKTNLDGLLSLAFSLYRQANTRVGTGVLNRALRSAFARETPVRRRDAKFPKLFYGTQAGVSPPTFICFVNDPSLFGSRYERTLAQFLRRHLPFPEIPLRIKFRGRAR